MTKNVLILDANQRSALAVARSLGKQSINVYTADNSLTSLAGSSRYTIKHEYLTSPLESVDKFVDELSELITSLQIEILLPLTDTSIQAVLHNVAHLPTVHLPYPDKEQYESVSNKASLFKTAETLGIPTPKTFYIEDIGTIPDILKSVNYNLVIKPYKSKIYNKNKVITTQVFLPSSNTQIADLIQKHRSLQQHPFMLQEFIAGFGKGLFALYNHGEPVAYFSHQRLREKPPEGGVSVLSKSVPVNNELIEIADKLLRANNWHGVAMVEFKVDSGGKPYLMEINARFWGSLQLAVDSGIDFPYLLYQMAAGDTIQPGSRVYKKSILRWILGDLDRLYIVLKSDNTRYKFKQKLIEIIKFLVPYYPGMHYETFRLNDIKPFLYELREYVKTLLHHNKA